MDNESPQPIPSVAAPLSQAVHSLEHPLLSNTATTAALHDPATTTHELPAEALAAERMVEAMEQHVNASIQLSQQADQHALAKEQAQFIEQETLTEALLGPCTEAAIQKHTLAQDQAQACAQLELAARNKASKHVEAAHMLDSHLDEKVTLMAEQVQASMQADMQPEVVDVCLLRGKSRCHSDVGHSSLG